MGTTQYRLAKEIGVSQRRIGEIVTGTRAVTADTGLRLSKFFGTSEGFWIGLQLDCDAARAKDMLADVLGKSNRGKPRWLRVSLRSSERSRLRVRDLSSHIHAVT